MNDGELARREEEATVTVDGGQSKKVEFTKDTPFLPVLLAFLGTPEGKEINAQLAAWLGSFKEGQAQKHTVEVISTVGRYFLMAGIIGAAVWLQHEKQLDSAVTGLLGLALGYLFGRQRSQE
jgi:hypothetical protein